MQSSVPGVEKYLGPDLLGRRGQLWRGVQSNMCLIPLQGKVCQLKYSIGGRHTVLDSNLPNLTYFLGCTYYAGKNQYCVLISQLDMYFKIMMKPSYVYLFSDQGVPIV